MSALGMSGAPAGVPPSIQIGGGPPQDGPSAGGSDGDWEQDLMQAISALDELKKDATDHQEASVIATCIAQLHKLTAQRQGAAESALGVTPAHKAMARAAY